MNRHLKGFICSVVVIVLCAVVTVATFAQALWYGVFPLALGIFFLIKFAIPSWKEYKEETTPTQKENPLLYNLPPDPNRRIIKEPLTQAQRIELGRAMLVGYYLDLGEETAKEMGAETIYANKRDLIQLKIEMLIARQEELHGTDFLIEDTDTNKEAREINSLIGKHCYAITVFFIMGLENAFPGTSFDDIVQGIVDLMDEDAKNQIFDEASSLSEIFLNDYLIDMIKNKIEERQGT